MQDPSELARSIAEAARTINKARSLRDTLQTIVEVACNSVPGFDEAGISTLERKGRVQARAVTGDVVLRLDCAQYAQREGPSSVVLQGGAAMAVSRLSDETRWPAYVPLALAAGIRSQLAVKLDLDECTMGSLNFYSTYRDDVTDEARALAALFATHAAIALGHAQERETFGEGLQSRRTIGQAIGVLMERYDMSEDRAFGFLVRASSHANIKVRAIAQELVDEANAKGRRDRRPAAIPRPVGVQVELESD